MIEYLKQEIEQCGKRVKATQRDPESANYWRGMADAYRDVLTRLGDKPAEPYNPGKPDNPRGLKVWGIMGFNDQGNEERCVIAAKTKAKAAKALDVTVFHLGRWGAVTSNVSEVTVALENPGKVVFVGGL